MKSCISSLTKWVARPLGSLHTFFFVFTFFASSVTADLASTYYLLYIQFHEEANPLACLIFHYLGFYEGAILIFIGDMIVLFVLIIPILSLRIPRKYTYQMRKGIIASVLSLSGYFYIVALDNGNILQSEEFLRLTLPFDLSSFQETLFEGIAVTMLCTFIIMIFPVPPYEEKAYLL